MLTQHIAIATIGAGLKSIAIDMISTRTLVTIYEALQYMKIREYLL